MRIAYLAHWSDGPESGVFKKILGQTAEWKLQGHKVALFIVAKKGSILVRETSQVAARCTKAGIEVQIVDYLGFADRLHAWEKVLKSVVLNGFDVAYYRYDTYSPAICRLMRKVPVVVEINTDDIAEFCLAPGFRCLFNRLSRGKLLKKAAGFVYVSSEFPRKKSFRRYSDVPSVIIANGISLELYEPLPAPSNEEPRIVFMGNPDQQWQGVDKMIALAKHLPKWQFDFIGPSPQDLGAIPPNIIAHGFLSRHDYESILAKADIGMGSLALHRKGMNEASTLKTREYLAFGLPTIIGYVDTDFPNSAPFLLRLPNVENNVIEGIEKIQSFAREWSARRVERASISCLDNHLKEQLRLEFFEKILSCRRKAISKMPKDGVISQGRPMNGK